VSFFGGGGRQLCDQGQGNGCRVAVSLHVLHSACQYPACMAFYLVPNTCPISHLPHPNHPHTQPLTGPTSHPGANFVVLASDGARIWLRDEKVRRKLAAELKVRTVYVSRLAVGVYMEAATFS
jgi:hypothetical protein